MDHSFRTILAAASFIAAASGCSLMPGADRSERFEIALLGDLPYSPEEERQMPALMEDMNRHELAFVVQNGDFHADPRAGLGGMTPCTDSTLATRVALFQTSRHPLIVTPGDNDWTDCAHAKPPIDPLQRLARLREAIYPNDRSLGQRRISVVQQSADPRFQKFRENARWNHGDVAFATIHVVGSNNNRGRTAEMDAEYRERNAASIAWLRTVFEVAKKENRKGVMIIIQANPRFEDKWTRDLMIRMRIAQEARDGGGASGYTEFVAALEEEVAAYRKPIVLVHGDSHYFRIDKPLRIGNRSRAVEHFTRVETLSTPDVHWLRATVDAADPGVFSFRQQIVEKNVMAK